MSQETGTKSGLRGTAQAANTEDLMTHTGNTQFNLFRENMRSDYVRYALFYLLGLKVLCVPEQIEANRSSFFYKESGLITLVP